MRANEGTETGPEAAATHCFILQTDRNDLAEGPGFKICSSRKMNPSSVLAFDYCLASCERSHTCSQIHAVATK